MKALSTLTIIAMFVTSLLVPHESKITKPQEISYATELSANTVLHNIPAEDIEFELRELSEEFTLENFEVYVDEVTLTGTILCAPARIANSSIAIEMQHDVLTKETDIVVVGSTFGEEQNHGFIIEGTIDEYVENCASRYIDTFDESNDPYKLKMFDDDNYLLINLRTKVAYTMEVVG